MGGPCTFTGFQKTSKYPQSQDGSIQTIEVLSNNKQSVSRYRRVNSPRDHAQYERQEVDIQGNQVQQIPSITVRECGYSYRMLPKRNVIYKEA